MNSFTTDWIQTWAKYTPTKLMMREHRTGMQWSYYDFNKRANSFANYLHDELGIKKGDRIAVLSKNRAEHVLIFAACVKIGAILVPLNFRLMPEELDTLISDAEPVLFLYEDDYKELINQIDCLKKIPSVKPIEEISNFLSEEVSDTEFNPGKAINEDDPVMILYTAGTTGLSKAAIITNKMLFWNSINTELRLDINSIDHTQNYAPFCHTGGWNVLLTPFIHHGASITLLNKFDAELILKLIEKEKTTLFFGVPTMLQLIAESPLFDETDFSSLRYAVVGGAPMPIPLIRRWHEKGVYIRQGYGLTEVGPNCFSLHQDDAERKIGSIGFPNFYVEAKIVGQEGNECKANEVGELFLKSPVVTPGYWRKEEATRKAITEGWFNTGDMLKKDKEGYYYVVDRKKNMFISGGINVYPSEIEKYIITHPAIKEVAVIGVEDEKWGQVGKALIVLNEDKNITYEEFKQFCINKFAKYKAPKHIQILDEIPKNEAGKIDRKKLKGFSV